MMRGYILLPRVPVCLWLEEAELTLGTGAPTPPAPPVRAVPSDPDDLFVSPSFVPKLAAELLTDTVFGPVMRSAPEALGKLVDRRGDAISDASRTSKGGTFLTRMRCGLLNRRLGGQGSADRLWRGPTRAGAPGVP